MSRVRALLKGQQKLVAKLKSLQATFEKERQDLLQKEQSLNVEIKEVGAAIEVLDSVFVAMDADSDS